MTMNQKFLSLKNILAKFSPSYIKTLVHQPRILLIRFIGDFKFLLRNRMADPPQELVEQLKRLNTDYRHHSDRSFLQHLIGTYRLLKQWNAPEYVCLAGLYHSIYGTQTFKQSSFPIESREKLQLMIGSPAENLVYYFCIRDEEHFLSNILTRRFTIKNCWHDLEISITEEEFINLLSIRLADHLEQMYYYAHPYWLKEHFLKAKRFLSPKEYDAFLRAYKPVL